MEDVTGLLRAWNGGDASALERLAPVVYAELHRLARRQMGMERDGHILQPSALVNEAFLRMIGNQRVEWASRAQFYAVSARMMRQILIEFARAQQTEKRGSRAEHIEIGAAGDWLADTVAAVPAENMLAIDEALTRLGQLDARQAEVVELRFFGGLDNREIAGVLKVSEQTVVRAWRVARAWLFDALAAPPFVTPICGSRSFQQSKSKECDARQREAAWFGNASGRDRASEKVVGAGSGGEVDYHFAAGDRLIEVCVRCEAQAGLDLVATDIVLTVPVPARTRLSADPRQVRQAWLHFAETPNRS
jgi:RNA polymerase sigma factor (TIGR02999 family)